MKLYHATQATIRPAMAAIEVAEEIVAEGFEAQFDHNHQDVVVSFAEKPLAGWGGWQDAWVVVEVPDEIARKYRYRFDDDLYNCKCYAFPEEIINQFQKFPTTDAEDYEDWN